jgi:hypothetical protein
VRASADDSGGVTMLGTRGVVHLAADGATTQTALPAEIRAPVDVGMGPARTIAVLTAQRIYIGRSGDTLRMDPQSEYWGELTTRSLLWLDDGRLLTMATVPDPLRGGEMHIRAANGTWVSLSSRGTGLTGAYRNGDRVTVVGTGWFANEASSSVILLKGDSIRAPALPRAP